jgi:serine/threonine protein kinase
MDDMSTTVSLPRTTTIAVEMPRKLGDYEVVSCLGGGGMGVVYEGRHDVLERRVALKVLRPELVAIEDAQARLLREAQALARVSHPNIVTLYEIGVEGQHVFLAMELLAGGTLREWLDDPHDWREIVDVFVAFGRGLAAVHALGLVHRDVNPANVFLDRDGTPKLGDFGLARASGEPDLADGADCSLLDTRLTAHGTVVGTPAYMAPEQSDGRGVDARADQYAFCMSLYEALAGELPRPGHARRVPRPLRDILARGLASERDERFPTIELLLAELCRARRGVCGGTHARV